MDRAVRYPRQISRISLTKSMRCQIKGLGPCHRAKAGVLSPQGSQALGCRIAHRRCCRFVDHKIFHAPLFPVTAALIPPVETIRVTWIESPEPGAAPPEPSAGQAVVLRQGQIRNSARARSCGRQLPGPNCGATSDWKQELEPVLPAVVRILAVITDLNRSLPDRVDRLTLTLERSELKAERAAAAACASPIHRTSSRSRSPPAPPPARRSASTRPHAACA